jgi:hypothetical protein
LRFCFIVLASALVGIFPSDNTDVKVIDTATEKIELDEFQQFLEQLQVEEETEEAVALAGSLSPMTDPAVLPLLAELNDAIIREIVDDPAAINPNLNVVTRADPDDLVSLADILTPAEIALILSRNEGPPAPPPVGDGDPPPPQQ